MARYNVTYSCGHSDTIQLFGSGKERASRIEWLENSGLCPECFKLEKDRELAESGVKAAAEAAEAGLPALVGSEKQIAWAENIRLEKIRAGSKDVLTEYTREILAQTTAKWWIDNRHDPLAHALEKVRIPVDASVEVPAPVETPAPAPVAEDHILRPEGDVLMEIPVVVNCSENAVSAVLPVKNQHFAGVAKKFLLKWDGEVWKRTYPSYLGPIEDRAAELGATLMKCGYIVNFRQASVRDKVVSGGWAPEHMRWIIAVVQGEHAGKLFVRWNRDKEDLYNKALRIPGAKWVRDFGMVFRPDEVESIRDFARLHDFRFTSAAEGILADALRARENQLTVTPVVHAVSSAPAGRAELRAEDAGDVDPDLIDGD